MARHLVVFFGMTASGKSTLAGAYATRKNLPYYNTDRVRKQLAGLAPTDSRPDPVGQGIYSAALTEKTYARMLDMAVVDFSRGCQTVILDGSYSREEERAAVQEVAQRCNAVACFIYCHCSRAEIRRRLEERAQDSQAVSDGRWEIYLHQLSTFAAPEKGTGEGLFVLDTGKDIASLVEQVAQLVG